MIDRSCFVPLLTPANGWITIPLRDEWQDPRHVFGGRPYLRHDIKDWLDKTPGGTYALLEDETRWVDHKLAFSRDKDLTLFLLRWS